MRNQNHLYDKALLYYGSYKGAGAIFSLFCFFFKRKYFIAVLAGVVISSLLAQFLKRVVYPDELRPISYLSENFPVHQISISNISC